MEKPNSHFTCAATGTRLVQGATLIWSAGGDGFTWGDEENWSDDLGLSVANPPGSSDGVSIGGMAEVEVNAAAGAAALGVSDALLKVNSDLTLSGPSAIDRLELNGRIINSATVMIAGDSEWKNGEMLGSGDVENRGSLTVDGGTTRLIQLKLFKNVGAMVVDVGIDLESATFENAGSLTLIGALAPRGLTASQLTNTGTITAENEVGSIFLPLLNQGGR